MGSECSVYKDYELEEPIESINNDWTLYPAHTQGDKTPNKRVTVFVHRKRKKERNKEGNGLEKSLQFLKVLRHPAILKYYGSHDGSDEVAMVTEPVQPLDYVLTDLEVDEIVAGLHNIVQALVFLHDKGGLSHNNVGLSSVYVSINDGSWKLGGMQCVCKFTEVNNEFLDATQPQRDTKSIAPEEKDGKVNLTSDTYHSLDAYGFGMLVCDVLDSRADLGSSGDKFGELMQSSFLHLDPKMRPRLQSLNIDDFFCNNYLEVVTFLNNITIKSDIDKDKFFSSLVSKLQSISAGIVAKRLLPRLLCRFVLAEPSAEKEFLPHILSPDTGVISNEPDVIQSVLPMDLFKEHCVPILLKLWRIKDLHVRIILLKFFPFFAKAFEKEKLEEFILPQMLLGLRDTDDTLVSATFHALAAMVPIIGGEVVVGGERQKYFIEGRPKFSLGSSPQIRYTSFSSSMNQNKLRTHNPMNVLDALHMENKFKPREEIRAQKKMSDDEVKKNSKEREKRQQEMARMREERRKERELKKADIERLKNENTRRTLLEVSQQHSAKSSDVKQDNEDLSKNPSQDGLSEEEDFDEWEDFQTGGPPAEFDSGYPTAPTKEKTSPTRFQPSNTSPSRFDLTDVDFTRTSAGSTADADLISWDSNNFTSDVHQPDVANTARNQNPLGSGKAMKLGTKKPNPRASKPKTTEESDLGKIFEVPEIKVKYQEPDFFSGMQPTLEFKHYDGGVGGENVKTGYSSKMSVTNTGQVEAGWDDEDWSSF